MREILPTTPAFASLEELEKRALQFEKAGDPKLAKIWMGQFYLRKKDYKKAIQCFEKTQQWETLADIYLTLGSEQKYHFYFAKYLLVENLIKEAAESFLQARAFLQAAQLFEKIFDFKKAIACYVQAKEIPRAGQLLVRIGHPDKAARLYEKAGHFAQACAYYQKTKSWDDLIRVYDRTHKYLEALKVSIQNKDEAKARYYLTKVDPTSDDYLKAHLFFIIYYLEQKLTQPALDLFYNVVYDKTIQAKEETLLMLSEVFEKAELYHEALQTLHRISNTHPPSPHVRTKIDDLEHRLQLIKKRDTLKTYENRFMLYQLLGRGAMSRVHKAKDTLTDSWVALKTFSKDQEDTEHVQAFFQETRATANLNHPNIVTILDFGIDNDHLFIAMEYLEGKTLQQVLDQIEKLSMKDFLLIASQLCMALVYAHDMHIVHRDIKPSNIMLVKDRSVKLMDFGIAKLSNLSNHISIARGTPKYVSPEQILGIQTTAQSDIYSLGVVLYQMLSGRLPFEGEDSLHNHVNSNPIALNEVVDKIPYSLVNIIMACLAKKPDRRPTHVSKVLEVIETLRLHN